jgi:hypothetical protein
MKAFRQADEKEAAEDDGECNQGVLPPAATGLHRHIAGQVIGIAGARGAESLTTPSPPIA